MQLESKAEALQTLGKRSTTELHPSLDTVFWEPDEGFFLMSLLVTSTEARSLLDWLCIATLVLHCPQDETNLIRISADQEAERGTGPRQQTGHNPRAHRCCCSSSTLYQTAPPAGSQQLKHMTLWGHFTQSEHFSNQQLGPRLEQSLSCLILLQPACH